uniref:Membrane-bound lytic murein transglycosylase F n=1 Tax=Magnetococcus massalia (strain MO-1) TaxID=451514 RepID=A0A1S7LED4_MAGMO|nr:Putative GH23 : membrane-bound lytic murein transglycosylase F (modular protein) [Candidatus Magnetococcus massalia]
MKGRFLHSWFVSAIASVRDLALFRRGSLLTLLLPLLASCDIAVAPPIIDEIKKFGEIRVVTRNAPTTYYQGRDRIEGFEYELVLAFAKELGVKVRFIKKHSRAEVLKSLQRGEAHLAAAGLIRREEDQRQFLFGPDYQSVFQQVVCRRGGVRPKNLIKLTEANLSIVRGSAYEARLQELRALVPQLNWRSEDENSVEQILAQVWRGEVDCTVADSHIINLNRRYYPELTVKFPVSAEQQMAWIMPPRALFLQREVKDWFARYKKEGKLAHLHEKYFGFVSKGEAYDYVDNRQFIRRLSDRLPRFRRTFMDAGRKYHIPWQLLAAQAYQESHWDPAARSPTGVRGIMMLTRATASTLGIKDRTDIRESINGGAWYLANMRRRLPSTINEPDRTWIALAAYNVGMGHIHDARRLAEHTGLDSNTWRDLRKVLPLLSRKKYYEKLKYGYARGMEPVSYVRKVRHYHDILTRMERKAEVVAPRMRSGGVVVDEVAPKELLDGGDPSQSLKQAPPVPKKPLTTPQENEEQGGVIDIQQQSWVQPSKITPSPIHILPKVRAAAREMLHPMGHPAPRLRETPRAVPPPRS